MSNVVTPIAPAGAAPLVASDDARRARAGSRQGRYDAIDVARGLAVLVMVAVHLAGTDGGLTPFELRLTSVLAAIEPTTGALFCVVAGISWAIQAERVGVTSEFRRYLAGRALALGVFGALFHVVFWTSEILVPFAMMMALSVLILGRGPRLAALVGVFFIAATPIVTRLLGDYAVTDWMANGLHLADYTVGWVTVRYLLFDGNYPLFSWMAFPLMGMVFWQTATSHTRMRHWLLGALGGAVVAYVVAAYAAPNVAGVDEGERYLAHGWTPSSAIFLLTTGTGALVIVSALLWRQGTAPMSRSMQPLVLFGRASLSHYVLHIAVPYSALRLWYPKENWPVTVGFCAMVAYLAIGVPLTVVWFRHHTHGPLETLWARTSRRPAPKRGVSEEPTSPPVEVRQSMGAAGVYARRPFESGQVVLSLEGRVLSRPTRHTIQLGPNAHLESSAEPPAAWVYLNHSCDANAVVDVSSSVVIARRPIALGEELRIDYHATEWELAEPFVCGCGAPDCVGLVRGAKHASPLRQQGLVSTASPHIRSLLSAAGLASPAFGSARSSHG
jgi:uncharacterized membrane protein